MSELKWTNEKPKEAGFYWCRHSPTIPSSVYELVLHEGVIAWVMYDQDGRREEPLPVSLPCQWSGPIPEPTEDVTPYRIDPAVKTDLNQRIKND
jgi:hypothetical protein